MLCSSSLSDVPIEDPPAHNLVSRLRRVVVTVSMGIRFSCSRRISPLPTLREARSVIPPTVQETAQASSIACDACENDVVIREALRRCERASPRQPPRHTNRSETTHPRCFASRHGHTAVTTNRVPSAGHALWSSLPGVQRSRPAHPQPEGITPTPRRSYGTTTPSRSYGIDGVSLFVL